MVGEVRTVIIAVCVVNQACNVVDVRVMFLVGYYVTTLVVQFVSHRYNNNGSYNKWVSL